MEGHVRTWLARKRKVKSGSAGRAANEWPTSPGRSRNEKRCLRSWLSMEEILRATPESSGEQCCSDRLNSPPIRDITLLAKSPAGGPGRLAHRLGYYFSDAELNLQIIEELAISHNQRRE